MPPKSRSLVRPDSVTRSTRIPMRRAAARWMSLLLGGALVFGCGGGGDDPYHLYPSFMVTDVVVIDLDGDGRNDVLTVARYAPDASHDEGRLTVYRQTTAGHFTVESYTFGIWPTAMTVTDVDGDDAPDVAIVDYGPRDHSQPGRLWLLRQDPAQRGRLLAVQMLAEGSINGPVAIGDLNGDGAPDIAIAAILVGPGENGVSVLYQNRGVRGSFAAPVVVPLQGRAGSVTSGDLDGDGRTDLVIYTLTGPRGAQPPEPSVLSVLRQQADGTLTAVATLTPRTGLNSRRFEIRDADGDGRADIMHYETTCCGSFSYFTVLLQGPIGTFREVATRLDRGPGEVAFGDLSGDGRVDVAGVAIGVAEVELRRQDADGTFRVTGTIPLPTSSLHGITAGDVDGDGRTDLVVVGSADHDNRAWVLLQVPGQPGTFGAPRLLP